MSKRYFPNGELSPGALRAVNVGKVYQGKLAWLRQFSSQFGADEVEPDDEADDEATEERNSSREGVWALHNINFSIAPGEKVAILGGTASGKSTLLQVLAGILAPSEGFVEGSGILIPIWSVNAPIAKGRTGYENLLLLAQMLRISPDRLGANKERIIEFSELGSHAHRRVSQYSSTMFHRLGTAMALNVDADFLLIDEAITGKDPEYNNKLMSKLGEIAQTGTTLILASRTNKLVSTYCTRGIVLRGGRLIFDGDIAEALKEYLPPAAETPIDT
jgi:ABC-2 type transport system ATP-binding protein